MNPNLSKEGRLDAIKKFIYGLHEDELDFAITQIDESLSERLTKNKDSINDAPASEDCNIEQDFSEIADLTLVKKETIEVETKDILSIKETVLELIQTETEQFNIQKLEFIFNLLSKSDAKSKDVPNISDSIKDEDLLEINECDNPFASNQNGKKIVRKWKMDSVRVSCTECSKTCTSTEYLESHMKLVHTRVICTLCNMSFVNQGYLKIHMKIHTGENKIPCEQCGLLLSGPVALSRHHLAKHTTERPFKCTECDYSTSNKRILKGHVESKHMDNNYPCSICGTNFKTRHFAKQHEMNVHHSEKSFKCDQCEKSFKRKAHLQKHASNLHSLVKIKCDVCSKVFSSEEYMKEHARQHDIQNHLLCPYPSCEKTFTRKQKLKEHINIHTGNTPYMCPHEHCGKRFTSTSALAHHKKACNTLVPIEKM